jgi:hypothetical protein
MQFGVINTWKSMIYAFMQAHWLLEPVQAKH